MPFSVCDIKRQTVFGIIDGNNFYANCERVFNPALNGKPIVVLSNNDGCAIARSNETKALGIAMGAPLHTFTDLIKQYDIKIFSANFELYGDLSNRMMAILQTFTPDVEVYSIDEAFIDLSRLPITDFNVLAKSMYDTVLKQIGIPITIGIAPTKTLAKVANRVAKKARSSHLIISTQQQIKDALVATEIGSVWGVGRALTPKLKRQSIFTAYDLSIKDPIWARKSMGVVGERLVRELQGLSCIPFNEAEPVRQGIQVTRSFGMKLKNYDDIAQAISAHATRLGEKLRGRKLLTPALYVFCRNSPFSKTEPYYKGSAIIGFSTPTNDTSALIKGALTALSSAFKLGVNYHASGVGAMNLTQEGANKQKQMFNDHPAPLIVAANHTQKNTALNAAIDKLNQLNGKDTVFFASSGIRPKHITKQLMRSPRYTTRWGELKLVLA